MGLRDGSLVGSLAAAVGLVVDLLAGSGQLLMFLVDHVEILLALSTTLTARIAPEVSWLSQTLLEDVVLAIALLYIVVMIGRLGRAWRRSDND